MHVDLVRLSGSLGAEIRGVDVADVAGAAFDAIRSAFLEHHVLVFREQKLSPEQQIAFGERWGALHVHPIVPHLPGYPPILCIANFGKQRTITEVWHSDVTFEVRPPMASLLYAVEVPEAGGDTLFANQHLAYERLSRGMKRMLEGMRAIHTGRGLAHNVGKGNVGKGEVGKGEVGKGEVGKGEAWNTDGQLHPVVRTHPETGRKALFVNRAFTVAFEDMTPAESQPLLRFLFDCGSQLDLSFRHVWKPGDLVLWDNRSVQHYAIHDYGDAPRTMHRVTVDGDEPS